jgi:hypothetical protein
MLSTAAFNALLKTLEEPPPHVKFIFATTEGDKVLPTIVSRCQRHNFRRLRPRPRSTPRRDRRAEGAGSRALAPAHRAPVEGGYARRAVAARNGAFAAAPSPATRPSRRVGPRPHRSPGAVRGWSRRPGSSWRVRTAQPRHDSRPGRGVACTCGTLVARSTGEAPGSWPTRRRKKGHRAAGAAPGSGAVFDWYGSIWEVPAAQPRWRWRSPCQVHPPPSPLGLGAGGEVEAVSARLAGGTAPRSPRRATAAGSLSI